VVLDDEPSLLGWMRDRLVAGIQPMVDLSREKTRVGRRAMWGRVSDMISQAMLMVAEEVPDPARYASDAEALISTFPIKGDTKFFVVERNGERRAFVTRAICCQAYKYPEYGYCGSCPMLTQEERERLAVEAMVSG
ncbi:MAG: (2Fe-2S)-binding protein, partial [Rubrobacteraceae bacterium]